MALRSIPAGNSQFFNPKETASALAILFEPIYSSYKEKVVNNFGTEVPQIDAYVTVFANQKDLEKMPKSERQVLQSPGLVDRLKAVCEEDLDDPNPACIATLKKEQTKKGNSVWVFADPDAEAMEKAVALYEARDADVPSFD